jgi:hypothetical protein
MNHKMLLRLYCAERLHQRWILDHLSDGLPTAGAFVSWRSWTTLPADCLALIADTSLPGLRVVRKLKTLIVIRGRPAGCRSAGVGYVDARLQHRPPAQRCRPRFMHGVPGMQWDGTLR